MFPDHYDLHIFNSRVKLYPTYPHHTYILLPLFKPLQQPYSVTLYLECLLGVVLHEQYQKVLIHTYLMFFEFINSTVHFLRGVQDMSHHQFHVNSRFPFGNVYLKSYLFKHLSKNFDLFYPSYEYLYLQQSHSPHLDTSTN